MGPDVDDEWWLDCVLPPYVDDPDPQPPEVCDDPLADVVREWSESELPPVPEWDELPDSLLDAPPVPWPGASMLMVGSEVLTQPGRRAVGDDTAAVPLEYSWVGDLTSVELVDAVTELQQQMGWLQGLTNQALARIADMDTTVDMWSREEVAAVLRVQSVTAGNRMVAAQRLCHDLPLTVEHLLAGRITASHARAVLETAELLPPELAGRLEASVLGRAVDQTVPQLRRSLRRVAITLNPEIAEQARKAARERRGVTVCPGEDGMSALFATLSAADAAAIYALLNAAADQQLIADRADLKADLARRAANPDDSDVLGDGSADDQLRVRTKDQIRADLLVEVILGGLDPEFLPTQQGRRPVINVHIGLDTLLGRDEEHGWLDGYGPITAQTARELAADQSGTWRRLITDPATRRLLDYDVTKYVPPRPVADHVMNTRPTCTFPGCARPAQESQLDHARRYSRGGVTVTENLHPLCARHHRAKDEAGWNPTLGSDGAVDWASPQRRRYRTQPVNRLGPEPNVCDLAGHPPDEPPTDPPADPQREQPDDPPDSPPPIDLLDDPAPF